MSESFSSELLSHPNKTLQKHLEEVGYLSKNIFAEKNIELPIIDSKTLEEAVFTIGICHDFGKATKFFQSYLVEKDEKRKRQLKSLPTTKHGTISALFTYYALKKQIKHSKDLWFLPILGFLAVKKHHGNLDDISKELLRLDDNEFEIIKQQLNALKRNEIIEIYYLMQPEIDVQIFLKEIDSIFKEFQTCQRDFRHFLNQQKSLQWYLIFLLLYSILLFSDKQSAAEINAQKINITSSTLVDNYRIMKKWDNAIDDINKIRNSIYDNVTKKISQLNLKDKIYSLNVPTGTGKTLCALSFALKLKEKITREQKIQPKIIYSLPFLSIIDQNFAVFEDVFKKNEGQIPSTNLLLKHHHLADIFYSTHDEEYREDEAKLLIEGWNAEIIVTTFVQLFHSLISNNNHTLRKFHNITNAIVILDEIQSVPHEYWLLIRELFKAISNYFGVYFIFVTATQPLIFSEEKKEIIELVTNKKEYFNKFDRIELYFHPEVLTLEIFKEQLKMIIKQNPDKDFLIVLNTIAATKELYHFLIEEKEENTNYYYLSTIIIPKQRLDRIHAFKEDKKRKIIISTQLIEAGVDLDVDIVYRDFAPLDSLNQVAGRCNRNAQQKKKGEVNIIILKDEHKEYYKYIYSSFLIDKTKEILTERTKAINKDKIIEPEFLELNESYFKRVYEDQSNDHARELLEYLSLMKFGSLQKEFHLIKESYEKQDVFIELDDDAKAVWEKYQNCQKIKDALKRRKNFISIKKQFYEYVISIPTKLSTPPKSDPESEISYVSNNELEIYYDLETGYKSGKEEKSLIIF